MSDSDMAKGYLNQARKEMSESQIEQAEAYAAACLESDYKDCD
jgi:hypothetical protein